MTVSQFLRLLSSSDHVITTSGAVGASGPAGRRERRIEGFQNQLGCVIDELFLIERLLYISVDPDALGLRECVHRRLVADSEDADVSQHRVASYESAYFEAWLASRRQVNTDKVRQQPSRELDGRGTFSDRVHRPAHLARGALNRRQSGRIARDHQDTRKHRDRLSSRAVAVNCRSLPARTQRTPSCPRTGSAALCGLPPIVAQYAAEAFVASDRSLACPPERQRDDVVEALVIALVVIVLDVFTHDGSKMPLARRHDMAQAGATIVLAIVVPAITTLMSRPTAAFSTNEQNSRAWHTKAPTVGENPAARISPEIVAQPRTERPPASADHYARAERTQNSG
jgi:hypothetical protein